MDYDKNHQPPIGINYKENQKKAINHLYGLVAGITADKKICDAELNYLRLWLDEHSQFADTFPLNILQQKINEIFEDGIVTDLERENIYQYLTAMIGNDFQETGTAANLSNTSIIQMPDDVYISNRRFCLTGAFASGTRDKCQASIKKFGGIPINSVTKDLDYLIVGIVASRDWIGTSHGRKIEKAVNWQQKGKNITIISEEYLLKFISL